jgi:hypothetical protein
MYQATFLSWLPSPGFDTSGGIAAGDRNKGSDSYDFLAGDTVSLSSYQGCVHLIGLSHNRYEEKCFLLLSNMENSTKVTIKLRAVELLYVHGVRIGVIRSLIPMAASSVVPSATGEGQFSSRCWTTRYKPHHPFKIPVYASIGWEIT